MDVLDLLRAETNARAADAQKLEFRRQYHEFRQIERLQRALVAARRRNGLTTILAPTLQRPGSQG